MDASKAYMKENQILPRISFADGKAHTMKLIRDKVDNIPDGKGGNVQGMKYLVEEGGEQKTIFTGSIGLISKLAACEPNDVVTIQMKKANNKSFFVASRNGEEIVNEDEAEVVADDEQPDQNPGW